MLNNFTISDFKKVMLIYRQGDVVYAFKMPRISAVTSIAQPREEKKLRVEDPASTGRSGVKPIIIPKYSDNPRVHSKFFVKNLFSGVNPNLIEACYAKSTWSRHCSALSNFKKFQSSCDEKFTWPVPLTILCKYTSWALTVAGLKPSTVKSYLSSLKIAHDLENMPFEGNHYVIKSMIRGAENLELYKISADSSRKVMTLPLLKLLGHQIAICDWSNDSKLVVWTACLTAFFGAFRFGEILAKYPNDFCKEETLLWNDVKVRSDNSILVHVKIDKVCNPVGSFIDLFEYKKNSCCAVTSLLALRSTRKDFAMPVFQFENGKNLCIGSLNQLLFELLYPVIGMSAINIKSHSFRAGLPSAMANCPDLANEKDIKAWGRWSSSSYLLYTRLKLKQKKCLFDKIVNVLDKN